MAGRQLRVASIPENHAYVRHIMPVGVQPWIYLPDRPDRPWWPPVRLSPDWITANADRFDIFHVHFGFDGVSPELLQAVCGALRVHDKPLVYTAHDLRNPHHHDPALHLEQMAVWVEHADAVFTLTHGAATDLRARFGIEASVVPHPHIVPLDQIAARRRRRLPRPAVPRVGIHLKSLRPNLAPLPLLAALPDLVASVRCDVQVNVHRDVVDVGGANHDPAVVKAIEALRRAGVVTVDVHDYFDEPAFLDYLAALDVSVLAYRFGTHSGWLEACRDLAVATVASDCGHYLEQGATSAFVCNETDGMRADTFVAAVDAALRDTRPPVSVAARRAQRSAVASRHAACYGALAQRDAVGATS